MVMGFGTNRVVGKKLDKSGLSATQMKGMNKLQSICGVRKIENNELNGSVLDKLSLKKLEGNKSKLMAELNEN
jgi:hypothetical protein